MDPPAGPNDVLILPASATETAPSATASTETAPAEPVVEGTPAADNRRAHSALGPRPTVLVVEDDDALRCLLVRSLDNDYNVIEAFDGQEALELIAKVPP